MVFWQLTVDAHDPVVLARFWSQAFGHQPSPPAEPETPWNAHYRVRQGGATVERRTRHDDVTDPGVLRGAARPCGHEFSVS